MPDNISPDGLPLSGEIESKPLTEAMPTKTEVTIPESKVEPEVQKPETKPEVKSEDTKSTDEDFDFTKFADFKNNVETKPEVKVETKTEVKPQNLPRDVSDLDAEIAPLFKQNMSNEAFNKLKPIVLEHKKLKEALAERDKQIEEIQKGVTKIPDSYYEHPQAYALTPEYAEHTQRVTILNNIVRHWRNQLKALREGATEYDYLHLNDEGKYAVMKKPADAEAESDLMIYLNHAQTELSKSNSEMEQFAKSFRNEHSNAVNWLKQFESSRFSIFDKEEGKEYAALVNDTVSNFPSQFRQSPLAKILAKSLIVNHQMATLLRQAAQQSPPAEKAVKEDKAKSGPTADEAMAGSSGNGKSEITFDDFQRFKEGVA